MKKESFTLIELLIVVALLLFILSITISRLSFVSHWKLSQEIQRLQATMQYLHQKSIIENKEYVLEFVPEKNEYSYQTNLRLLMHKLDKDVKFGFIDEVKGPPAKPSKKIRKSVTFPSNTIHFYPQGTISSGAVYVVTHNKNAMKAITSSVNDVVSIKSYVYRNKKWSIA